MLKRWPLIAAAGLLAYAAWEWSRQQADLAATMNDAAGAALDFGTEVMASISGYSPDKVPAEYRQAIADAEAGNGLPAGMLARLLWQESRYSPRIISGQKRSSKGAVGIAQFMPATARDMGIDPTDPYQSIAAAGRYLGSLYRQTGDWSQALAAYNWGIGNIKRKGLSAAPAETQNYLASILSDIGLGGLIYG